MVLKTRFEKTNLTERNRPRFHIGVACVSEVSALGFHIDVDYRNLMIIMYQQQFYLKICDFST